MEAWEVVQGCQLPDGSYDKENFLLVMSRLPPVEFDRFSREILHLRHFYDSNQGVWVTDHIPFALQHPDMLWKLKEIDFDAPINFIRIR